MIEYLPQALSSLSTALDIGKRLSEIQDSAKLQVSIMEFNNAIIDAQSKILSSQNEQTQLTAQVQELKNEIEILRSWAADRDKYVRTEIASGIFVYLQEPQEGNYQSAHKFCCNCFDNFKKSTLQQFLIDVRRRKGLSCHNGCPDLIFNNYIDVT